MKRVLCVWFPQWPLQRLLLERPELRHRPVLIETKGRRGREVRLASRPARQRGVCAGMPLVEAEALLEPLPGAGPAGGAVCLVKEDPAADRLALEQRAAWCQRYSPIVGLEEGPAPETLLLSLDGCAHLLGGEEPLARQVARDFTQGGHHVRTAVADTIGAAWGLAHYGPHADRDPLLTGGKSAAARLDRLPADALRLAPAILTTLRELGVQTVGQLRGLPRSSLPSRLGPTVIRRLDQMAGEIPELITPYVPAEPRVLDWSFEEPVSDREILESVLQRLIEQLVEELEQQRAGIRQLDCRLYCLGSEPVRLSLGAVRPRADARHWRDLVRLLLERNPLPAEVLRMEIEAVATGRLSTEQATLFDGDTDCQSRRELESLLDRLSSRLGHNAVLRPEMAAEHQPEWAGRFDPVTRGDTSTPPGRPPRPSPPEPGARPLALKPRPIAIEVLALAPAGAPARFTWTGTEHVVSRSWGPERIETGWWGSAPSRRDYYRVETTTGLRYWLFHDRDSAAWFLQGVFE